jgi:leucyl aminopeptidase
MPVDSYHHDMIKPKTADLTNASFKPDAGSCQAAAFL